MNPKPLVIPTHVEASVAQQQGNTTPLSEFVLQWEPAGRKGESDWRMGLAKVLAWATLEPVSGIEISGDFDSQGLVCDEWIAGVNVVATERGFAVPILRGHGFDNFTLAEVPPHTPITNGLHANRWCANLDVADLSPAEVIDAVKNFTANGVG